MGWKTIGNHSYYYCQRRVGRRVISEYGGGGDIGYLFEWQERKDRAERAAERERLAAIQRECEEMEARIEQVHQVIETHVAAELAASGCYLHKREWRRGGKARSRAA